MRFVVFGAGGVGGVVGGRLAQHGYSVALIARGEHYEAIRRAGLRLESPDEVARLDLPVVDHPARVAWTSEDVVLLTMKSQDTLAALEQLAPAAPPDIPILCMQNGVANERMALERFENVYGVCVYCAAGHLVPGVVQAWSVPLTGILDLGRYPAGPAGADALCEEVALALRQSNFLAVARADIMRWKYRKLLMNLGNAVEALCGPAARGTSILPLLNEARREGVACLEAAGIDYASDEEEPALRERQLHLRPIGGRKRPGGSSWQSLERRTGSVEADYLNGEIVLLGREHGVSTPVNELLQRLANETARAGRAPGSMSADALAERLDLTNQQLTRTKNGQSPIPNRR